MTLLPSIHRDSFGFARFDAFVLGVMFHASRKQGSSNDGYYVHYAQKRRAMQIRRRFNAKSATRKTSSLVGKTFWRNMTKTQ